MSAILRATTQTIAATPIGPVRLSFMISRIRSRGRELKKPSAVSARPSMWRPPETAIRRMTARTLVTPTGKEQSQPPVHKGDRRADQEADDGEEGEGPPQHPLAGVYRPGAGE